MDHNKHQAIHSLSKDASVCLKGIFAIMVLLHHYQQRTTFIVQPFIGKIFELLGFLAVSIFLFFSGYGLILSYEQKGKLYLKNFLKNRILPFYCINVFLILLSILKNFIIGTEVIFTDILSSLFLYKTIITYGWYIQTILLFYILFYVIFNSIKQDKVCLILMILSVTTYMVVSHIINAAPATYISTLSFVLGVLCGKYLHRVRAQFKNKTFIFLLSLGVFSVFIILSLLSDNRHIRYVSRIISSPFFTIAVLMLTQIILNYKKQIIINKVMKNLGEISLEIYVAQGFFFDIFRSDLIYIANNYIYVVLVTVATFLLALLIHPIFSLIFSLFKKETSCTFS